jgi:hypothetical protein
MTDFSKATLRLMSDLLHDAKVQEVIWDQSLARFTIRFDCLRRNVDGSALSNRTVEFKMTGVQAVGVGYDSCFPEKRPSQFEPPSRISANELAEWPFRLQEGSLCINSALIQEALESARLDWFKGNEESIQECPYTFCLMFDQWGDFGMPMLHVRLMAGGDEFTIMSGGLSLDLDDWEKQYAAWWTGWKQHWDAKESDADEEGGEYELAIPAGEPETPDLGYRPPAEPIFDLEPTDAPPALIGCIRQYFESHHHRDWDRMAQVYPNATLTAAERAKQLESWNLTDDFGRWGYARRIDDWWIEGSRGCVVLRGIEHQMAFEGHEAKNCETVWTFVMHHRAGRWITVGCGQGWPGYRSAMDVPAEDKPWLRKWKSGNVV